MLSRGDDEQRVAKVAAYRLAGRPGHRSGIRIDADYERVRSLGSRGEGCASVAGAEVYRDARVLSEEASEVAGVEVADAATPDDAEPCVSHASSHCKRSPGDSMCYGSVRLDDEAGCRPSEC
jgi:hypothetical protein